MRQPRCDDLMDNDHRRRLCRSCLYYYYKTVNCKRTSILLAMVDLARHVSVCIASLNQTESERVQFGSGQRRIRSQNLGVRYDCAKMILRRLDARVQVAPTVCATVWELQTLLPLRMSSRRSVEAVHVDD